MVRDFNCLPLTASKPLQIGQSPLPWSASCALKIKTLAKYHRLFNFTFFQIPPQPSNKHCVKTYQQF